MRDEEKIIDRARKQLEGKNQLRKIPLAFGIAFIGAFLLFAYMIISKLNNLPQEELTKGFIIGFSLAIVASTFGVIGAICMVKALIGFADEFEVHELLLIYHKRLYPNKSNQSERTDVSNPSSPDR